MLQNGKSLLVCYVSGLDLRRVNKENTPFLFHAMNKYPQANFKNLPSNELFPTLVTGVDPSKHGVWGVRLNQEQPQKSILDNVPDIISTSFQGFLHLLTSNYDLAGIPPKRRKRLKITRTKYKRRIKKKQALFNIGGIHSVFDVVGQDACQYFFDSSLNPASSILPSLCSKSHRLEVCELYSLDRFQQWNLDRIDKVLEYYSHIDNFFRKLHTKCKSNGYALMIVSDHGHEQIRDSIDIISDLTALGLPEEDTTYFIEVSNARFWFHTQEAREKTVELLQSYEHGTVLSHYDMHSYGIPLHDDSYGEVFIYLDPGYIFFPHDFHQPLANFWLGITDPMQRSRLRDPRHKGNHGHLPHFPAERAFTVLLDKTFRGNERSGAIIDIAPTILAYLNCPAPQTMKGTTLFSKKEHQ